MYKKPETDAAAIEAAMNICQVSADGRVGVDSENEVTNKDLF